MADSFVFYASFAEAMDGLNNEQYGELMRAINEYAIFDKWPKLTGVLKIIFTLIKPQIDANTVKRNSYLQDVENGKKGGRPERFTQEEKLQIALENHDGVPVGRIADEYKCSISLIYKVLNEVSDAELGNYINSLHLHKPVCVIPQTINDNVNVNVNDNVNANANENDLPEPPTGVSDIPPEEPPKTKINRVTPPDKALELAHLLATLHKNYDSAYAPSEKHIATWATDIDKLNRIDKRAYDDIEQVIRWVKTDGNFWLPNIMSGAKLREKFPVLYVQMIHPHTSRGGSPPKNGMDGDQSQQSKASEIVKNWKTGVYA